MTDADVAATMAATFADEWVRAGVTDVVLAPGSRSTPIALAVLDERRLRVHVHVDERSAAFIALGLGLATGRPAPVVTTSGTAAVELHPAVVEAHHAAVPMILCTADRPPELHGIASPQTIDQRGLYAGAVRAELDLGPPDESDRGRWRSWAARSVLEAKGEPPGPVHCNLAFREPLLGTARELPPGRPGGRPWHRRADGGAALPELDELDELVASARSGVLVAGRGCRGAEAVTDLGGRLGWPVLADPMSGLRAAGQGTIAAFDALLRHAAFADEQAVGAAVQFGAAPASKVLQQWLRDHGTALAVVAEGPELPVAGRDIAVAVRAAPGPVAAALATGRASATGPDRAARWLAADRAAQRVFDRELVGRLDEPAVARTLVGSVPGGADLVVSSSMPVRDVEWFGPPRGDVRFFANRGANGIDGVLSTAVGVALAGRPTVALLGDLAFLHDSNGLLGAAGRPVDLTVVVVDNDGGGIFSFLPQAGELPPSTFETAFGTPHGLDLVEVARAHGAPARRLTTAADLVGAVQAPEGVAVVVVGSDRAANVAVHDGLEAAVGEALRSP